MYTHIYNYFCVYLSKYEQIKYTDVFILMHPPQFRCMSFSLNFLSSWLIYYWVGQKVLLGFSLGQHTETRMNFLSNQYLSLQQ